MNAIKKVILTAKFVIASILLQCSSGPGSMEQVTVGTTSFENIALNFIAEELGLFKKNGLEVKFRRFDLGLQACDAVINKQLDIASCVADYVFVTKVFHKEDIKTIASISKVEMTFIVARKDHGIHKISDLEGKRIGYSPGTSFEFHLKRFFQLQAIKLDKVILVDAPLAISDSLLVAGELDAIISAPPYINDALEKLNDKAVVWDAQSSQLLYTLAICRNDWIKTHPVAIEKFIKSLAQAEDFILKNPEEAKKILSRKLDLTIRELNRNWAENDLSITLDQSLIYSMEDEARFMIENRLTKDTAIPDFLDYLYIEGLQRVKPEALSIVRAE